MGLTQLTAGIYSVDTLLNIQRMTITGLQKTHSYNKLVTDSAAAGTAMACGCKTRNGYVGVDHKKKPCKSILEYSNELGLSTGLIANSSITHATPASFVAHNSNRYDAEGIAEWFLKTKLDFFVGGGQKYFEMRSDGLNLTTGLKEKGWSVSSFRETKFNAFTPTKGKPFAWFSAWEEPESILKGRDYLVQATHKCLPLLKERSEKGFFVMIEGSQIDWACHANDSKQAIAEILEFDKAVGEAMAFADQHPGTLVLVTADHETGGMAISQGRGPFKMDIEFNSKSHTATMVPVYAYGAGAELFGGIYDNTLLFQKMKTFLGASGK